MAGMTGKHHSEETRKRIQATMMGIAYPITEIERRRKEKYLQLRLEAMKIVGKGAVRCVCCGCDDARLLEINHKNGGGSKESGGRTNKQARFMTSIRKGLRSVDDLDLRCRVCNALHYAETKYGRLAYKIEWVTSILASQSQ